MEHVRVRQFHAKKVDMSHKPNNIEHTQVEHYRELKYAQTLW